MGSDFTGCPAPKVEDCLPCSAGATVKCPGSGGMCAGNQCCPGTSQSNNQPFACPSAASDFTGCPAPKVDNCLDPACAASGQSCQNNGDCCDNDECHNLYGGNGKICVSPSTSNCVVAGAHCSPTCTGCPLQQCCGGSTCKALGNANGLPRYACAS